MLDVWIMAPAQSRRDWLVRGIGSDPSIHVAGVAPTFAVLRSLIGDGFADVIIIDIHEELANDALRDWLSELEELAALLLIVPEHNREMFSRTLQNKPGGMLRADAAPDRIVQAVKSIASGLITFDAELIPPVDDSANTEPLTARETEVLRLLADGLGNKEIASNLGVSEHTIKFHIGSILGKLGASSRTEAVSRGLRSGLIEM
jgi:DNA-binding NarL/FixJ family response regulator